MLHHGFYILSTQPLIVSFIGSYPFFNGTIYENNKITCKPLPKWFRPKHVLEHIPGWCATPKKMLLRKLKSSLHSLEGRRLHLMVNASDEEETRKRFFVRGGHFHHNLYINEYLYQILDEPKVYDAIYTAQLNSSKRLELAKNIEKLMVVSYGGDLHSYCPELKHADFNRSFLPRTELAKKYNQSYAGLILSAVEGGNLASSEYLLCGIPVVSTPSKGGRDEFFTPENSIIIPPEPEAVAQAVQTWKQLAPNPQEIREQTLKKIRDWRLAYCNYIAQIVKLETGITKDAETIMNKFFAAPNGINSRFMKLEELHQLTFEEFNTTFAI
jgi:glycosyltransferase involved in cell wall biosynthesis